MSVRDYLWLRWLRLFPDLCLRHFGFVNLASEAEGRLWTTFIQILVDSGILERKVLTAFATELRNVRKEQKPWFDFDAVLGRTGVELGKAWEFKDALRFLIGHVHTSRLVTAAERSEVLWRLESVVVEREAALFKESDPRRRLAQELILGEYKGHCERLRRSVDSGLFRGLLLRFLVFYVLPAAALLAAAPLWIGLLWDTIRHYAGTYGAQIVDVYATMFHHLVYGFESKTDDREDKEWRTAYDEYLENKRKYLEEL